MNLRHLINQILLAVSLATIAPGADLPGDWPMFRGDSALQGIARAPLPEKPALLWKFKTEAAVKSSAVVAGGKVFIGSEDQNIYALDFQTGAKIWAHKTEGSVDAPGLFADGKLFVGSTDGLLYALDANSGQLLWKYKTDGKILGAPNQFRAPDNSLRLLIGSYDNRLHCVDAADGKSNWVYETGNYINGSPAVADGKTVFGGCDGLLHVISVADGNQLKEI